MTHLRWRGDARTAGQQALGCLAVQTVESQNRKVHEAPWTTGRFNGVGAGGLYEALELGQLAYKAHKLPYEEGLSKMKEYPPRRFRWVYDETGSADDCVRGRDTKTGRLAPWRYF